MLAQSGLARQHCVKRDRERIVGQASVPTADEMISEATQMTGWTGGVDVGLREGLERTLLGFAEAPLTEAARADAINAMRGDLATRFRICLLYTSDAADE